MVDLLEAPAEAGASSRPGPTYPLVGDLWSGAMLDDDDEVGTTEPVTRIERVISTAALTRVILFAHSIYMFASGVTWPQDDLHPYHITWLSYRWAFMVCIIGVVYALFPRFSKVGIAYLLFVGLAAMGRWFDILIDPPSDFVFGEQVRAFGWVFQWALVLIAFTQITAARALGRSTWAST